MSGMFWWRPWGSVNEIAPAALQNLMIGESMREHGMADEGPSGLVIVDVRTAKEYASGHLKGSINVPITQLKSRLASNSVPEMKGAERVVFVCEHARRSIPAVRLGKEFGWKDSMQLKGGVVAWRAAKLTLETGDKGKPGNGEGTSGKDAVIASDGDADADGEAVEAGYYDQEGDPSKAKK